MGGWVSEFAHAGSVGRGRIPTGDEVTALLLLILAGENDTSFHPARTTRRSREEDELSWRGRGRLSRVD